MTKRNTIEYIYGGIMGLNKEKETKILELYKQGLGINKIASMLKIKKNIIKNIIDRTGVQSDVQNAGQDVPQEVIQNEVIEEVAITKAYEVKLTKQQKYINTNFDILVEMIEAYKSKNTTVNTDKTEIIVELPLDQSKEFKTSIRVNKVIWEQFKEFCKSNKNYTQKDLVSMAMLEYMQKYK